MSTELPQVAGRRIAGSNADFERAALVCLGHLQETLCPHSSLRDVLCEAVRLCREYTDHAGAAETKALLDGLRAERDGLYEAIAEHHKQKSDDRCWMDDDRLYAAAGLPPCDRRVGNKAEMLKNCATFIHKRCEAGGWPSYVELEKQLATERAARADAESAMRAWITQTRPASEEELQTMLNAASQRAAQAEARLADALNHIRWLQPMAKGWAHAHESITSNHRIVLAADEFLSSTAPPTILAELADLRATERAYEVTLQHIDKTLSRFVTDTHNHFETLDKVEAQLERMR